MSKPRDTIPGLLKNLTFEKFFLCHQSFRNLKLSYKTFRGYDHTLYTIEQLKNVFSNFDSKVHVHTCNVHTSFYGSKMINKKSSYCHFCKSEAITYPYRNDNYY